MIAIHSIAFVDDHPLLLDGLKVLFGDCSAYRVVATGKSAEDAIRLSEAERPDILVLDLSLPGDAFAAIETIVERVPQTRIVAFTASANIQHAVRALKAGARAYVLKGSTQEELLQALAAVLAGENYITPSFASKVITALATDDARKGQARIHLSVREDQIVKLLLGGRTNREIGEQLHISEKTVKQYMSQLMQKLEVRNRVGVVLAAQQLRGYP